jgi:hypothetical protein
VPPQRGRPGGGGGISRKAAPAVHRSVRR